MAGVGNADSTTQYQCKDQENSAQRYQKVKAMVWHTSNTRNHKHTNITNCTNQIHTATRSNTYLVLSVELADR